MRLFRAALWLVPVALVAACTVTTPKAKGGGQGADGATCTSDHEGNSGQRGAQSCVFSQCSCSGTCTAEGTSSSDCPSGWLCVHYPPDAILGYFGANGDDLCTPGCTSCPQFWSCGAGATACGYSSTWANPVVTVTGPSSAQTGQMVSFHAAASSPTGAHIVSYSWDFNDTSGATAQGPDVTYVFVSSGTFTVNVTVNDDSMNAGYGSLAVTVGRGAGDNCANGATCCPSLSCDLQTDGGLPVCR